MVKYIFLLLFAGLISCQKAPAEDASTNFEKKVFDDIFLQAVDSTLIDMRTYTGFHYSEKQKDSIKKDTLNRVVAFNIVNYKIKKIFQLLYPKALNPLMIRYGILIWKNIIPRNIF